jgi:hypothetical protein
MCKQRSVEGSGFAKARHHCARCHTCAETSQIQSLFLAGDGDWAFPQTPSGLENCVWGSKLWPSQSPVSASKASSAEPGSTHSQRAGDATTGKSKGSTAGAGKYDISVTCSSRAYQAAHPLISCDQPQSLSKSLHNQLFSKDGIDVAAVLTPSPKQAS